MSLDPRQERTGNQSKNSLTLVDTIREATSDESKKSDLDDVELLRLIHVALEASRPKPFKPRVTLLYRLRRVRKVLRRFTLNHPVASVGIVACAVLLTSMAGFTLTIARNAAAAAASRGAHGPRGSSTTSAGSIATARGNSGRGRVVDENLVHGNVAKELLQKVIDGDFELRSDIATGRFLQDFQNSWLLLADVDATQLQPVRRGRGWVQVRGPYKRSEAEYRSYLMHATRRLKTASEAMIRLVKEDDVWKLEHIRVY